MWKPPRHGPPHCVAELGGKSFADERMQQVDLEWLLVFARHCAVKIRNCVKN